ncbi:MAG: hypothetical protein AABZ47_11740 [Planctomycetota bacterium]
MGFVLSTSDSMMCPHGGNVSISSTNTKAKADAEIVRPNDTFTISGCPLTLPNGTPHPCMVVEWQMPSSTSKADGASMLTTDSIGMCKASDQATQGTVLIQKTQTKVSAR